MAAFDASTGTSLRYAIPDTDSISLRYAPGSHGTSLRYMIPDTASTSLRCAILSTHGISPCQAIQD
eukprot:2075753-Rhodomonas_salina.1